MMIVHDAPGGDEGGSGGVEYRAGLIAAMTLEDGIPR